MKPSFVKVRAKHRKQSQFELPPKQAVGLSKSGLAVFEVYKQIRENPNSDQVQLSFYRVSQHADLNDCTYQRGLRELLDKKFIFRSPEDGTFFVNIQYIVNGDRLAFVV